MVYSYDLLYIKFISKANKKMLCHEFMIRSVNYEKRKIFVSIISFFSIKIFNLVFLFIFILYIKIILKANNKILYHADKGIRISVGALFFSHLNLSVGYLMPMEMV